MPVVIRAPSEIKKQKGIESKKRNSAAQGFKCNHCSLVFKEPYSLGGHVSKVHPRQQSNYANKMETYRARTKHRENLVMAKKWFKDMTGRDPKNHRLLITKIKIQLMAGEKPESDFIKRRLKLLK